MQREAHCKGSGKAYIRVCKCHSTKGECRDWQALGSAYVAMNSKAIGADLTIAWPDAEIGSMDAALAAKIMYEGQGADVIKEKAAEYAALQTSATGAARRGYVDQIIEAADTRKYVIGAFEMLFTKREDRPSKKHGTV